jgi:hypothetical protein
LRLANFVEFATLRYNVVKRKISSEFLLVAQEWASHVKVGHFAGVEVDEVVLDVATEEDSADVGVVEGEDLVA